MDKKPLFIIIIAVALLAVLAILLFAFQPGPKNQAGDNISVSFDPLNAAYTIEGVAIKLVNGKSEIEAAPGSAMKITTNIFGEPVIGDINVEDRKSVV